MKKKALYLGLRIPETDDKDYVHYPVIEINPVSLTDPSFARAFKKLSFATHLIFTSQSSLEPFFTALNYYGLSLNKKIIFAVGRKTASVLRDYGLFSHFIALQEQAEGLLDIFETMNLKEATFFWGRSSISRPLIINYLKPRCHGIIDCTIYETKIKIQKGFNIKDIDEIHFTSPSTVDGFLANFGAFPNIPLIPIGEVTQAYLKKKLS